jgi:hypothetical protein
MIYIYTNIQYTCTHICIYTCIYIYLYLHIHSFMYLIHIYSYIYTYIGDCHSNNGTQDYSTMLIDVVDKWNNVPQNQDLSGVKLCIFNT